MYPVERKWKWRNPDVYVEYGNIRYKASSIFGDSSNATHWHLKEKFISPWCEDLKASRWSNIEWWFPIRRLDIRQQVPALLQKGEFLIREWCSNIAAVLYGLPPDYCEKLFKFRDGTDITKTLGLVWDPKDDISFFVFKPCGGLECCYESLQLSSIVRIYDPLGEIFMQLLWKLRLDCNESLPQSLYSSWIEYIWKIDSIVASLFLGMFPFPIQRYSCMRFVMPAWKLIVYAYTFKLSWVMSAKHPCCVLCQGCIR